MFIAAIVIFNIFSHIADGVYALTASGNTGVTATGQTYICLPTGTSCPTTSTNATLCAAGSFPCFGAATQCGQVFLPPNTTADGPSSFGAYPWQAYLSKATGSFSGSGVLLDSFHVLTTAHKVFADIATPSNLMVSMGVWNLANRVKVQRSAVAVAGICIHPQFQPRNLRNDIAVLTLAQPIVLGVYSNINTACLAATGASTSYVGQTCRLSGWGQSSSFTTNPQIQVSLPIVSYSTCRTSMAQPQVLGNNVDVFLDPKGDICAGGMAKKDACTQDGGSPLICYDATTGRGNVAGLASWGKNCGQPNVYGVFVNVPFYYNWIQSALSTSTRKCAAVGTNFG